MIVPRALTKGDTIGLLSASGATPSEKLAPAIASIEKLGFNVIVGETCRARHGYLAGSDELRAYDVNEMFRNPHVDGIFVFVEGTGQRKFYQN